MVVKLFCSFEVTVWRANVKLYKPKKSCETACNRSGKLLAKILALGPEHQD